MLRCNAHISHSRGEAMWSLLEMSWQRQCWHSAAAKYEVIHVSHLEERFSQDFYLPIVHAFKATDHGEGGRKRKKENEVRWW